MWLKPLASRGVIGALIGWASKCAIAVRTSSSSSAARFAAHVLADEHPLHGEVRVLAGERVRRHLPAAHTRRRSARSLERVAGVGTLGDAPRDARDALLGVASEEHLERAELRDLSGNPLGGGVDAPCTRAYPSRPRRMKS